MGEVAQGNPTRRLARDRGSVLEAMEPEMGSSIK